MLRRIKRASRSFGGGLSLPSSIQNARSARKHYRKLNKAEGKKRAQGKKSFWY
jgi:hypothetical protein